MEIRQWLPARLRVALNSAWVNLQAVRHGLFARPRAVVRSITAERNPPSGALPSEAPPLGPRVVTSDAPPPGPRVVTSDAPLRAVSFCALRSALERGSPAPRAAFRDLRVERVVRQTADAVTLVLDNRVADPVRFRAGQYLTLVLEIDGRQLRRAYSLCSDPAETDRVELTVKRIPGGRVSTWIHEQVQAGQVIRTLGPGGTFGAQVRPGGRGRRVLVGAGVGITPLYAMAQTVAPNAQVELIVGNRRWVDVIFQDELARLAARHPGLRLRHVLTRPAANWAGLRGRLERENLRRLVPLDPRAQYFVCGPEAMMQGVVQHLHRGGIAPARIHTERFVAQGEGAVAAGTGAVHRVHLTRSNQLLLVPDTETVLDRALAAGVALPSSCRMGGCGACRQRVLSGEVAMEQPNCLTAEEREQGFRLLCIGRPVGPLEIDA